MQWWWLALQGWALALQGWALALVQVAMQRRVQALEAVQVLPLKGRAQVQVWGKAPGWSSLPIRQQTGQQPSRCG